MRQNFMTLLRAGEVTEGQVDDYVSEWHRYGHINCPELHIYLGLTDDEYSAWVLTAKLPGIAA